jgi:hypothetical protein
MDIESGLNPAGLSTMAGNSALTVSVGADITDLQTKVAQAKVEFQAASAAMMKVARDPRRGSCV